MWEALGKLDPLFAAALVGGIFGLLGGFIPAIAASIVKPRIEWGIEKEKKRDQRRLQAIDACRKLCEKPASFMLHFNQTDEFSQFEKYLDPALVDEFNQLPLLESQGREEDQIQYRARKSRTALRAELSRIERDWELI